MRHPCTLDARPAVRRPGLLGDGELPPPGPRPARLDGAGAARLAGLRPGAVAAAERLSTAAAPHLPDLLCVVSWQVELAGMREAGGVKEGGVNTYLEIRYTFFIMIPQ